MANVTISCACGERFHTDGQNTGRRIRCRSCGRTIEVRAPAASSPAFAQVKSGPPPLRRRRRRPRVRFAERAGGLLRRATSVAQNAALRVRPSGRPPSRIERAVTIATWSYLAATLIIALVMWQLGDLWWPATLLLFMGRWLLLLPLLPLLLATLWARRRRRRRRLLPLASWLPLAVAASVTLGPIMGGHLGWRQLLPEPKGMLVRLVSFNADGGRMLHSDLTSLVHQWNADIVAIQECGNLLAGDGPMAPGWHLHQAEGLCLLTRFPIVAMEQMPRESLARLREGSVGAIGGSGYVIRYTLTTPRGPIDVTNLHLETPRKGFESLMSGNLERLRENTELRDIESGLARRWVDAGRNPSLIAGDFNTPVESRIFQDHWGDLDDVFSQVGAGLGMTKFNGWIRVRIDHVLFDRHWRPVRVSTGGDVGSDHVPLTAELRLIGAASAAER